MITRGKNNIIQGEYVETDLLLINTLTWHLYDKYIVYTNASDIPVIRISMNGNQLVYEYYDFGDSTWHLGGSLTPTDPTSARFPQVGGSYIYVTPDVIKQYINDQIELSLSDYTLDLHGKTLTGLIASDDLHSAVTLEQVYGIVAGDSTDTIVSADLHTRVKVFSAYVQFIVGTYEALHITKPDPAHLQLNVQTANNLSIQTSAADITLYMQNALNSVNLTYADSVLGLDRHAKYSFDTAASPLAEDELTDLATVRRLFVAKTADSNLNMNGYYIKGIQNASNSYDAVSLGQLSTHYFLFLYSNADQPTSAAVEYVQFYAAINPQTLSPPVSPKATQTSPGLVTLAPGTYRISLYVAVTYYASTQSPVYICFEGTGPTGTVLQSLVQGDNTDDYTRRVDNQRTFVLLLPATEAFRVRVDCNPLYTQKINAGSSLDIQLLQ